MAATVSTGYLPVAVSAESITASVPSSTAFATSETSARVGIGLLIIDSIICVAVMTSRFFSRAMRIMRFCSAGTDGVADLHGEIAARHHDAVGRVENLVQRGIASARSIFATVSARPPALCMRSRAQWMSSPERGNETPEKIRLELPPRS